MTLFDRAQSRIPGGVNSPVRSLKSVGSEPVFMKRGQGAFLWDEEENSYLDFCLSWGALILGHAPEAVVEAVQKTVKDGSSFGCATKREVDFAEELCSCVPSLQQVRLVNSGTEAVMSALRLARGFTKRNLLVKFDGCYHGHADSMLVKAGSGVSDLATASSAGVPEGIASDVIVLPFNDCEAFEACLAQHGDDIAAVIVEPVPANMGVILPQEGFLNLLRKGTRACGALLIFDEVITGFRSALGGAQEIFGIDPDLTCLGKIIGAGFPLAAFGGRKDIMQQLAPCGPVYQAGTLSGNPVAVAAGQAQLSVLKELDFYPNLLKLAQRWDEEMQALIRTLSLPLSFQRWGSMGTLFFSKTAPQRREHVDACDRTAFAACFQALLKEGIYLSPSQYEACFLSGAHTLENMQYFVSKLGYFCSNMDQ